MKKKKQSNIRPLVLWVTFGLFAVFSATILYFWITQDIAQPIPMAIFIGALLAIAFMLFSDKMNKEDKRPTRK
jgi:hypothetical protein